MNIVVYYDKTKLDAKYIDSLNQLESDLTLNEHNVIKLNYADIINASWAHSKNPEYTADAYVLMPGGIMAKNKFIQHLNLKDAGYHDRPVILLNLNDDFTSIADYMHKWCSDSGAVPDNVKKWFLVATSINEAVNALRT